MSKYTTEFRNLIEMDYDYGQNSYPIFDETYRKTLNTKIQNHYYMREIGFETAGLFKLNFTSLMSEIMPKYNELYKLQRDMLNNIDKMYGNVDLKETVEREQNQSANSSSSGNVSTNTEGKDLFQDTPQGNIPTQDIDAENVYATNLSLNKNNGITTSSDSVQSEGNSSEDYIRNIVGTNGKKYKIEIYKEIVNNIMNIDQKIIKELSVLFMGIY